MTALPPPAGPAQCPACGAALAKMPQRKTKCKGCGQFIYVGSRPADRTRRLMTEAQKVAAEAEWLQHGRAEQAQRDMQTFGALPADLIPPAQLADLDAAIERAHVLARGGQPTKMAILGLLRSGTTATDVLAAHLALILIDLQQARTLAFTAQLRCGPYDTRRHCGPCERLRDTIISTDAPIEAVAPMDCPRLAQPVGRLRGACNVMVQAWIKRPDGTMHLDRRPTPARTGPPMTAEQIEQTRKALSGVLGVELPKPAEPAAPAPAAPWWRRILGKG